MEPKLKAVQIIMKMQFQKEPLSFAQGKKCALIAVNEIEKSKKRNIIHFYRCGDEFCECGGYWQEVKEEIEKL